MARKLSKKARWKLVLETNKGERFFIWQCGGDHRETIILNGCVAAALCPNGHTHRRQEEVPLKEALSYDYTLIFGMAP